MDSWIEDVRFAFRSHRRTVSVSLAVVAALGLGIGATGAIFSVVSAQLVRALPFANAERLIALGTPEPGEPTRLWAVSLPDVVDLREALVGQAPVAAWSNSASVLTGVEFPERIDTLAVEPQLLEVLQVVPALGRGFLLEEGKRGAAPVAMLTHEAWRRRFGADPTAVGRTLTLDKTSYLIVGVLPPSLRFPLHTAAPEVWVTLGPSLSGEGAEENRNARWLQVTGRLQPGATLEGVRATAETVMARLAAAYPDTNAGYSARVEPLRDRFNARTRKPLLLLLGAALVVLLLACANASNLLLARASQRRTELAVRMALGASPSRLLRQFVAEAVVLGLAGGAVGIGLTVALVGLARGVLPPELGYLNEIRVDGWVLAFGGLLALLTGLVVSLAPTWSALRLDPQAALKASSDRHSTGGGTARVREGLVVLQTASAAVLMVAAGLLLRSAWQLGEVDPGFDARGLFSTRVTLYEGEGSTSEQAARLNDALLERLSHAPGVGEVAAAFPSAFGSGVMRVRTGVPGAATPVPTAFHTASPRFFSVMRTPLLRGREFSAEDRDGAPRVAVVNALLAATLWPGRDPLGQQLTFHYEGEQIAAQVVGVVANVLHAQLDGDALPQVYVPQAQWPMVTTSIVLRSSLAPRDAELLVRSHLRELAPNLPLDRPDPLTATIARSVQQRSFQTSLIAAFALLAVLIAAHGVYAVTAYAVARRTREIGIRVALGAQRRDVLRLVLGRMLGLAVAGAAIGVVVSLLLGGELQPLLYRVRADEPAVLSGITLLLAVIAAIAGLGPSLRAARTDPTVTLRGE